MKLNLTTEVAHERDLVFEVQRDRLPELVRYLPNVESIERVRKEQVGDVLHLRNEWVGSSDDIPGIIKPMVKPEWLTWSDEAEWDGAAFESRWVTHLRVFPGAITSQGTTRFEEDGSDCLVSVHGEFTIDPTKITMVPPAIAKRVAAAIERFVVSALETNMRRTFQAVEEFIDDHY